MARVVRCLALVWVLLPLALSSCASWARLQQATVGFNYPHASGEGLGLTPQEHYQAVSQSSAKDTRALIEDLDLFFLTERPTRLTRWHDR